jgi:hypothetical protein
VISRLNGGMLGELHFQNVIVPVRIHSDSVVEAIGGTTIVLNKAVILVSRIFGY